MNDDLRLPTDDRRPSPHCPMCGMADGSVLHDCGKTAETHKGALAAMTRDFHEWWRTRGQYMDPDTEDVPWFDKRKPLSQAAYYAGRDSRSVFRDLTMDMLCAVVDLRSDPDRVGVARGWIDQWRIRAESALQSDPGTLPPGWRTRNGPSST